MPALDYAVGDSARASPLLLAYTRILIGFAVVCVAALVWAYLDGHDSLLVIPAFVSPAVTVAAMLQYRGVMLRRRGHAIAAAVWHFACAGLVYFAVAANVLEDLGSPGGIPKSFVAAALAMTTLATVAAIAGILTVRWANNLLRQRAAS
jgi:hypothetical protein